MRCRTLTNESYGERRYRHAYDATVTYSAVAGGLTVGGEAFAGRNVFGENFSRVADFIASYAEPMARLTPAHSPTIHAVLQRETAELFVDAARQ